MSNILKHKVSDEIFDKAGKHIWENVFRNQTGTNRMWRKVPEQISVQVMNHVHSQFLNKVWDQIRCQFEEN
jgi:hypothetical protein